MNRTVSDISTPGTNKHMINTKVGDNSFVNQPMHTFMKLSLLGANRSQLTQQDLKPLKD
jgi:hypothetical protein